MKATGIKSTICLVMMIITLSVSALAVMPPAPREWYDRINMPVPETIKNGFMPDASRIEKDLAAVKRQPDNTDHLLLILVEFPDNQADQVNHPSQAYEDMMFSIGVIPSGSLVEYYQEVSYGAFTPAGTVTVWIMAPHPYSYYSEYNGMGDYPNNSQGLLEDCVGALDLFIDFSEFDTNGDGYANGIFLVHAGPGAEETGNPDDIWSHAWYYEVETDDGVSTGRYSIEPEEFMNGSMISIGVYCHEYGHVLGLPDLYDYDGSSEGIGVYCLMAGGSWGMLPGTPERPAHLSAEMKRSLDWMIPTVISGSLTNQYVVPAETNPVCYRVNNPLNPNEYFLIENRAKIGFDSLMRGDGGLAIWHVDRMGDQNDETHRRVSLEQADGNSDLERDYGGGNSHPRTNRGDAGELYPGAADNDHFTKYSNPNSFDYTLAGAFLTVANITQLDSLIRADIMAVPDKPVYHECVVTVEDNVPGYTSNLNGEADFGEVVDLILGMFCEGEGASSLVGTLRTDDTRVALIDSVADFASVAHNEITNNNLSRFRLEILSESTESPVFFTVLLNADGDTTNVGFAMNINRQKILLVLDNNRSHWSDKLLDAMTQTGYSFDTLWNGYYYQTNRVTYDDLIPYHAVVWTNGSYFGNRTSTPDYPKCLTDEEVAVLAEYLDNNGRLGLFSQDYLYDRGVDAFASSYLYVAGFTGDVGSASYLTAANSPFLGQYNLKTWSFYNYTDHLVKAGGAYPLVEDDSLMGEVMIGRPIVPQVGDFAASYSSFSPERLDDSSLVHLLTAWCQWVMQNPNIDVPKPISPAEDTLDMAPVFIWQESPGAVSYNLQVATDFEFTNLVREVSVPFNSTSFAQPFANGAYYWRVNASPDSKLATAYSPRARFVINFEAIYVCGDANGDGGSNVGDAVYIINYVFKGGPGPDPICTGDANGDGDCNVGDAVYLINFVFNGGPAPVEPCCP